MKKILTVLSVIALVLVALTLNLSSCEINQPVISSLQENTSKTIASIPLKVAGTAGIGAEAFFFEFDMTGKQKFARAYVPVSSNGFLKNNKILYKKEQYPLKTYTYDPTSGYLEGSTAIVAGVSYFFAGLYSNEAGFLGNIKKIVNGVSYGGAYDYLSAVPVFSGKNLENYIGYASFNFDSDTTALIFNARIDAATGQIFGTWCETKPGLGNIHGTIAGTREGQTVKFTGTVWDAYKTIPGLYLDTMSAEGEGWYKNPGEKTIAGGFTIHWVGDDWYSDFIAARVDN